VRITWDMARAQRAGLKGKDMYARFPRQMLRSRCVSEGVRTVWPGATSGMYVPEEITTIEHEPDAPSPREQINAEVPVAPPAESTPKAKGITARVWLDAFEQECADATNEEQANSVLEKALQMEDWLRQRPAAFARYETIKAGMLSRIYTTPPDEDEDRADEPVPDEADIQLARAGA
jgi:hypothetical protein